MGSKRTKQHEENDFNIGEEEAELFYSLKNAFSNLVLDEKGKEVEKKKQSYNPAQLQFGISDHKAIAQQIEPDQIAKQLEILFSAFLPAPTSPKIEHPASPPNTTTTTTTTTTTSTSTSTTPTATTSSSTSPTPSSSSPTSPSPAGSSSASSSTPNDLESTTPKDAAATSDQSKTPTVPNDNSKNGTDPAAPPSSPADAVIPQMSDIEKFEKVENEIFLISETVQYMQHVLPPTSQRTIECLSKVTDQYVKGWPCIENKQDLRQRFCIVLDKIGGWWLDEFLLFPELTIAEKEKWLNTFLRNWTRADGTSSGIEGETSSSMRIAPSRRPTPPPSPPETPMENILEYDEYIARQYQQRYEDEHARAIGTRADSNESMDDFYLAAKMASEEREEIENRRLMSEIEKACAETEAKELSGDADNAEMGDVKTEEKGESEIKKENEDEGMGEGNTSKEEVVEQVKEENMAEDKMSSSFDATPEDSRNNETVNNVNSSDVNITNNDNITNSDNSNNNNNNNTNNNNNNININNNNTNTNTNSKPLFSIDQKFSPTFTRDSLDLPSTGNDVNFAGRKFVSPSKPKAKSPSDWSSFSNPNRHRRTIDSDDDEEDVVKRPSVPEWLNKHDEDERSRKLKRGRSEDDLDEDSDSDFEAERMSTWKTKDKLQSDKFDQLNTTWRIIKNMQIVGSMRFELYKKCGMYDEALKIAQALQDREKIMESRVLARETLGPEKNDDDLEKAMSSMLHL